MPDISDFFFLEMRFCRRCRQIKEPQAMLVRYSVAAGKPYTWSATQEYQLNMILSVYCERKELSLGLKNPPERINVTPTVYLPPLLIWVSQCWLDGEDISLTCAEEIGGHFISWYQLLPLQFTCWLQSDSALCKKSLWNLGVLSQFLPKKVNDTRQNCL